MLPELPHDPTLDATAHDIRRAIFRCWMAHKYDRVGFLAAINEEAAARRLPDVAATVFRDLALSIFDDMQTDLKRAGSQGGT